MRPSEAILQTAREIRHTGQQALFRLAPTPSGFLHTGNLYNFLVNWICARLSHSRVLLRVDDLDQARIRPAYLHALFQNLRDLGLDWDLGPESPDQMATWSQHRRLDLYREKKSCLQKADCMYPCLCSRKDMAEGKPCTCRQRELSEAGAQLLRWRKTATGSEAWNDLVIGPISSAYDTGMVLWRRDDAPAYQLASVTDDLHFGVTHVFRGVDLLPSTAFQLRLMKTPCFSNMQHIRFGHHPLIADSSGRKLSKSAGSQAHPLPCHDAAFRQELFTGFAAWASGIAPSAPIRTLTELQMFFVEKDSAL
jgi:glutamyl-tRNA synthetase